MLQMSQKSFSKRSSQVNQQTQELVWQGAEEGFRATLTAANEAGECGRTIDAHCMRASAYYSRYASLIPRHIVQAVKTFRLARWHARLAHHAMHRQGYDGVTHGQFDVVGTILLRSWLWYRPNPKLAHDLLRRGLGLNHVPPHARALMIMGLAEARYLQRRHRECLGLIEQALILEKELNFEEDLPQAQRQFARVLRRAGALLYRLGESQRSAGALANAKLYASYGTSKSKDQEWKQRLNLLFLQVPSGLRWLVPN